MILVATAGDTLEFPSAAAADSGFYWCSVMNANGQTALSDSPAVFISSHPGQRLLNYSSLGQISAAQPTLTCGFVVEPGPGTSTVLVRAVGPSLAQFGVVHPLAAPQIQSFDSKGNPFTQTYLTTSPPVSAVVAAAVGAFPAKNGDVANVYTLSPGSYTVQVSAADGGSGAVLVEVYEVPQQIAPIVQIP